MQTKDITISILKSDLVFSIQNTTHKLGKSIALDDGSNLTHVCEMQANNGEQDAAIIDTAINECFSDVMNKVEPYVASYTTGENLVLNFSFPSNWNGGAELGLNAQIFKYLTDGAVYKFLINVNMNLAERYFQQQQSAGSRIKELINSRIAPVRKPSSPL